jgi:hypothetical protein
MNGMGIRGFIAGAALVIGMALVPCGCMQTELASDRLGREITIDGKAPEWAGREAYYNEDEGLKIGFSNDDRYLYVYFSTWHRRTQMQILMNGLTVWIDANGGKKESFGVNYPVGASPGEMRGDMPTGTRSEMRESPADFSGAAPARARDDLVTIGNLLASSSREIRMVGPDKEPIASFSGVDSSETAVQAMIGFANRTLIYELKLPLAGPDAPPFAVNAGPGASIGIGFKVGQRQMPGTKREGLNPPEGMEGGPGGMGGGPGGGGGDRGGFPGGGAGAPGGMGGRSAEEPLALWVKVKLAAGPETAPRK